MADASDAGLIARNPVARAKPPRPSKPHIKAWSRHELDRFLRFVENDPLYPLWHLMAMTGLRRGEALAIRMQDLDLASQRLVIRQNLVHVQGGRLSFTTPKNHSARPIDLAPETVSILRSHRVAVSERRLSQGHEYQDQGLLFSRPDGSPLRPDSVTRAFSRLTESAVDAGVVTERLTPYGLRHSHGTIAIAGGVAVKVITERLGHSSPAFTMSVYQHVSPSMQTEAAAFIAELIRGGKERVKNDENASLGT